VLTPRQAKGLEFDHVVVVEPAAVADDETAGCESSTSRSPADEDARRRPRAAAARRPRPVNARVRKPLLRIAAMWGVLLLAFVVGWAAHSVGVFVAILGAGLVVEIVLRLRVRR